MNDLDFFQAAKNASEAVKRSNDRLSYLINALEQEPLWKTRDGLEPKFRDELFKIESGLITIRSGISIATKTREIFKEGAEKVQTMFDHGMSINDEIRGAWDMMVSSGKDTEESSGLMENALREAINNLRAARGASLLDASLSRLN